MFENLTPPNNYITYALRCQWKFDFVKNLTMARSVLTGPLIRTGSPGREHMFDS